MGLAVGGPVQQCLQAHCAPYSSACNLLSACRHELIDCMTNCTSSSCEVQCFTTASNTLPKLEIPALIALDVYGGYNGCFPSPVGYNFNKSAQTETLYNGAVAVASLNVTLRNVSPLPLQGMRCVHTHLLSLSHCL